MFVRSVAELREAAGQLLEVVAAVQMRRQDELPNVAFAVRAPRPFPGARQCRQQECGQNRDDGDDDQQLDQRKRPAPGRPQPNAEGKRTHPQDRIVGRVDCS